MASRLPFRASVKATKTRVDMSTIELEEDNEGGLILACHRRSSQISMVSEIRDSIRDWMDGSIVTEPTRVGKFDEHYSIGETIHKREWTRVDHCKHRSSSQQRIVKVIKETCSYCHEYEVLSKLDHPNFPVVYEIFKLEQDGQEFYMVLRNYPGGSLEDALENLKKNHGNHHNHHQSSKTHLKESHASRAIWQVLSAANYLHHRNIVHCNLRPEHILLRKANHFDSLTIISFTSSFTKEAKKMNYIRGEYDGNDIVYLAPEILQDIPSYDEKADMWSCGVILYRLLSNTLPFVYFESDTEEQIRQRILKGDLQFPDQYWKAVSRTGQDFVRLLLETDPNQRPSAEKALQHPWLAQVRKEVHDITSPKKNAHSLDILGNLPKIPAAIATTTANNANNNNHEQATTRPTSALLEGAEQQMLVLKLRQALCVAMVSRLLTNDQTIGMDEVFNAIDTNHNGTISPQQLAEGYQRAFSEELSQDIIDKIWQRFDLEERGELHYSEFKVAAFGTQDWLTSGRIKEIYQHLDKHGKGTISVVELTQADIFAKAQITGEDIVRVMEMVDTTGSGFISFTDFKRLIKLEFLSEETTKP